MLGSKVEQFISNEDMTLRLAVKHPLFEGSELAEPVGEAWAVVLSVTKATPPGMLEALVLAADVGALEVAAADVTGLVELTGAVDPAATLETRKVEAGVVDPAVTVLAREVTSDEEGAIAAREVALVEETAAVLLVTAVEDETLAAELAATDEAAAELLARVEVEATVLLTAGVVMLAELLEKTLHLFEPPHMSVDPVTGHLVAHMASVCKSVGTVLPHAQ